MRTVLRIGGLYLLAVGAALISGCGAGTVPIDNSWQVEQWRKVVGTPGLAIAVTDSQRTFVEGAAGVRVAGGPAKVTSGDLWHIGSSSKTMTATYAAVLVQQGKISWDTTVGASLSDLPDVLPAYKNVTLADLLSHRSGLPAYDAPEDAATIPTSFPGDLQQQRSGLANWALQQQPVNQPGSTVLYSNAGYLVAAVMLEHAAQKGWEQGMQESVWGPLGLKAKIGLPGEGNPNQPWGHQLINGVWTQVDPNDPANQIPTIANPVGNVSMDVSDYAKWARINLAALRGEDSIILKASEIQKLHASVEGGAGQPGQALAWYANQLDGHLVSATDGSDGTFWAVILIDPQRNRAVVVLANGCTTGGNVDDPVLSAIINLAEQELKK